MKYKLITLLLLVSLNCFSGTSNCTGSGIAIQGEAEVKSQSLFSCENGKSRVSPVGLAFKLSETDVTKLIENGKAVPLKYFPKGHIKKVYALFENPDLSK